MRREQPRKYGSIKGKNVFQERQEIASNAADKSMKKLTSEQEVIEY